VHQLFEGRRGGDVRIEALLYILCGTRRAR
jgi:hypothetical protein